MARNAQDGCHSSVLNRFGEQDELDAALLPLAYPASSYMTCGALVVDRGITATV